MTEEERLKEEENFLWNYRVWRSLVVRQGLPGLTTPAEVDAAVREGRLVPGADANGEGVP